MSKEEHETTVITRFGGAYGECRVGKFGEPGCDRQDLGPDFRALHVELGQLAAAAADLPGDGLAAMCAHGERAVTAASVLERAGREGVAVVIGGPDEWAAAHHSLVTGG